MLLDHDGMFFWEGSGRNETMERRNAAFQPQPTESKTQHRQVTRGEEISDRQLFIEKLKNGEAPVWKPKSSLSPFAGGAVEQEIVGGFQADRFGGGGTLDNGTTARCHGDTSSFQHRPTFAPSSLLDDSEACIDHDEPTNASALHSGSFGLDPASLSNHFRPPTPVPGGDFTFRRRDSIDPRPLMNQTTFTPTQSPFMGSPPRAPSDPLYHPRPRSSTIQSFTPKYPSSPLARESKRGRSPTAPQPSQISHHRRKSSFNISSSPTHGSPITTLRRRSVHNQFPLPTPLVGSYEESILSLRMSLPPSKPLPFLAQIGVLATGPCRASLKCPPHVTVPFSAVFYGGEGWSGAPSPYTAMVELPAEKRPKDQAASKKTQTGSISIGGVGAYRIPPKGQVQVVIKNENKTGIKLFLVPYDLTDMPVGTKTFLRQKSYVITPDIPIVQTGSKAFSSSSSDVVGAGGGGGKEAEGQLRYMIQLNFCCPKEGRVFLWNNIRVVFANRTLDGKEKLRNEVVWAEPRWSAWRKGG